LNSDCARRLERLNPKLPPEALEDAYKRLTVARRAVDGHLQPCPAPAARGGRHSGVHPPDGSIGGALVHVIDFDNPDNNDWVAVNQFTVVEGQNNRGPMC